MKRFNIILPVFACSCLSLSAQQKKWTLQDCMDYAVEHSLTVKKSEVEVNRRKVELSTARNSRLPELSASAGEYLSFGRGTAEDNTYISSNTYNTSFNLGANMPLLTGGRIYYQQQISRLNLESAVANLSVAKENVMLSVIRLYLEAIYQRDLVDVAKRQLELSEAQVRRTQLLYENSKASAATLAQVKATKANDEVSLTQRENSYMLALLNLSQILELETPEGMELETPVFGNVRSEVLPSPDVVYSEALGSRPQMQVAQIGVKSAEKNVKLSQSAYYPTLSMSAGMGTNYTYVSALNSFGQKNQSFAKQLNDKFSRSLSFNLQIPIFTRFQTRNNVRAARLGVISSEIQLDETRKALYKEIQQAYYDAVGSQRKCVSSDVSLASSQEAFELMTKKFENGKATHTEYQESKVNLQKAEMTAIQAKYTFFFKQKILEFYRKAF